MAKIYVSSTFLDLKEYREQVERVIRRTGHTDVAMEYYTAEDTRPVAKCLADVAACDVYVGIFAWRYGWQPKDDNPDQLSITEMEFRQAEKTGKPCFIFLLSDDAPWPRKHIDKDTTKIEALRNTESARHTADYFTTPDELARKVAEAIYKQIPAAVSIPEHNLDAYYKALRKRYNVLALEGLTPPQKEEYLQIQLRQVFVEQSVREEPPPVELPKEVWEKLSREQEIHKEDLPSGITLDDVRKARESYYHKPSRPVLDVLTDSHCQYTIILGDPGSGKSTLARYVMLSLIDPSTAGEKLQKVFTGYLPLLIELRTYTGARAEDNCKTFLEFLEFLGKTEGWALTQAALNNHLKNDGRAVVIFDGLDEIFDPEQREQITRQIVGFCNDYPKARIIVTSRILGYRRKILTDAGFTHFTLQDLDKKQVKTFITRWYDLAMSDRPAEAKERRERILKSFKDSASIRQLAGNPMLLTIMAIIGKHQELPRERWKLYDHAASVLIQHWDVNKHLKDESIKADFIGEDDKKELLRRLAFRMQGGDSGLAGNYIHRDDLQIEFESYLRERYSQTPDRAKVIADAMIQQFRERNFILSLYGASLYGFVHRAFLEYYCASAFVWKFEKTKELTIEQLKTDVYGRHWEDQSWHEVLRLICGMMNEKWVGEIIDFLVHAIYRPWPKKFGNRLPWNIALAVQCLGETRNIGATTESAKRLLVAICELFELSLAIGAVPRDFFEQQILVATQAIGSNWPSRDVIADWLERLPAYENSVRYSDLLGKFIGMISKGINQVERNLISMASNANREYRILVPFALGLGFSESPSTSALLRRLSVNDSYEWVRTDSISVLAEYYRDDAGALLLLRERAVNDEDANVRNTAVSALAQHYRDDAGTLPLLRERAINDEDANVRNTAVSALAQHYRDDVGTLPLLRERAVNDMDTNVCSSAVRALGQYFGEDTQTLPLLQDWVVNSQYPEVRSSAVSSLAQYFRKDAQTLPLLRDRAINDTSEDVRSSAVRSLAEYFGKDAQTLLLLRDWVVNSQYPEVRSSAVDALVNHFREDAQTLPLLRDRVINDTSEDVRSSAVRALGQYFREDTQTLPLLQDWVVNSQFPDVRSSAVRSLGQYFNEDAQTLPLLRDWVVNSKSPDVRSSAVRSLGQYFNEDAQTLPLLRDRVINDTSEDVRSSAVRALGQYFHEDAQTLPLLRDCAVNDTDANVHSSAVRALAQYCRKDAQTALLLRDRALNDISPRADAEKKADENYVREAAINSIARYWPTHPDTLPLLQGIAQNDPTPWLRERAKELIAEIESKKA